MADPTFFERFQHPRRYDIGTWKFNEAVFQVLEWMLVAGALRFIAVKYESEVTSAVAFFALALVSIQVSLLVGHGLRSLLPSLMRAHFVVQMAAHMAVFLGFYYLMRAVFDDIAAHGI